MSINQQSNHERTPNRHAESLQKIISFPHENGPPGGLYYLGKPMFFLIYAPAGVFILFCVVFCTVSGIVPEAENLQKPVFFSI